MSLDIVKQEEEFFKLRDLILDKAKEKGIKMRLIGALAVRTHVQKFRYILYLAKRFLSNIDFVCYRKDIHRVEKLYAELGWEEDRSVYLFYGGADRRLYRNRELGIHSDIFIDMMRMNHDIDFRGRLELDYPTVSLVDLLLTKLQIVKLADKDIQDIFALLREHKIGSNDREMIDGKYLASLCAKDWGLWRTVTSNLEKLRVFLTRKTFSLKDEDVREIQDRIEELQRLIDEEPKSLKWKIRAKIGEKRKWYRETGLIGEE